MYLNAQRHMAAPGVQIKFLSTPYGGASIEWVKQPYERSKIGDFSDKWALNEG